MREAAFNNGMQVSDSFTTNIDLSLMRKPFGKEWM